MENNMNNSTATKTIMIVDDDNDYLNQQRIMLEAAGFNTVCAESQEEAESLLAESLPDMAILDLMMGNDDDGFALAYHIKKLNKAIPVILVSAVSSATGLEFDTVTDEERSWIKADAFLDKPVRFEQLMREIKRLLKG
jgi:two-component system, OmpR family, response regulator